jgi:glycosyltransferase involved in cell wall biosynthesis
LKVLHVISNLGQGGAEGALYRLIAASSPGIEHAVVSMMDEAYYGPRLRAAGILVHTLECRRGRLTIRAVCKLMQVIRDSRPDVVQTWMYHADLVGGLVARFLGVRSVVWSIRQSNLDPDNSSLSSRIAARSCAFLSNFIPSAVVCCSSRAAKLHVAIGYQANKVIVIPNGFDLSRFSHDAEAKQRVRLDWNVAPNQILLGMVARWDPQKDHGNLLTALAQLKNREVNFQCVLVGTGMDLSNADLTSNIDRLGLTDRIILAGSRDDIPSIMSAFDIHVLSSAYGEAFPNVVAEAMACGIPCVVTDVGDAALIVGTTGKVVPPQQAKELAEAILQLLAELKTRGRLALAQGCREKIESHYDISRMVARFNSVWQKAASEAKRK